MGVHVSESLHGKENRRLEYCSTNQTLGGGSEQEGGIDLAKTVVEQTSLNLKCTLRSVAQLGAQYIYQIGLTVILGHGAIAQKLLAELKHQKLQTDRRVRLQSDGTATWESGLLAGTYTVEIEGLQRLLITVSQQADRATATACVLTAASVQRWRERQEAASKPVPEAGIDCHLVQIDQDAWRHFTDLEDSDDLACIHATVNGGAALDACICDFAPHASCPSSSAGSAGNGEVVPLVLREMPPTPASQKWKLSAFPMLRSIVDSCIAQQFDAFLSATDETALALEPTGESVYVALARDAGDEWMSQQLGEDRAVAETRLATAILDWLRRRVVPKEPKTQKKRKGLQKTLKQSLWKKPQAPAQEGVPVPTFFRGQRVLAHWTDNTGRLVSTVNADHNLEGWTPLGFKGTIAAEGVERGFWRVIFDDEDGSDHPSVPAQYITINDEHR